jgi:hypothetical protein
MSAPQDNPCSATFSALANAYHRCPDCGHMVMAHKNISWAGVFYGPTEQRSIQFSQTLDPEKWEEPGGHSIWVGHPSIARGIVRFLRWLTG